MKRFVTSALLLLAASTVRAENRSYDCGLVTGLLKMAAVTAVTPDTYGDVYVHAKIWKLRADRLTKLAEELTTARPDSSEIGFSLAEAARTLSYIQGGYGDVYYWVEKNRQLSQLEQSTKATLTRLGDRACE